MTAQRDQSFTDWMSEKTFLVVEDMSSSRMLEAGLLRGLGAKKVVAAVDGADALAKLNSGASRPDIIISDWVMPGMDGLGLLEAAKALCPTTKFVMLTAKADTADMDLARSKGVDGYIAKPFSRESLVAALRLLESN